MNWHEHAACLGHPTDLWHPTGIGGNSGIKAAKAICADCPVRLECLNSVLDLPSTRDLAGIYGGLTVTERKSERARRNAVGHRRPVPIKHGTPAGAAAHRRRGEAACPACLDADTRYAHPSGNSVGSATPEQFTTLAKRLRAVS